MTVHRHSREAWAFLSSSSPHIEEQIINYFIIVNSYFTVGLLLLQGYYQKWMGSIRQGHGAILSHV